MDYEKKYKEALTKAESYYRNGQGSTRAFIYNIFPELAESEGEKIKKYIINFINLNKGMNLSPEDADRMISWLEKKRYSEYELENEYWRGYDDGKKQGEQKPVEWNEEDDKMLEDIVSSINHESVIKGLKCRGINYSLDMKAE